MSHGDNTTGILRKHLIWHIKEEYDIFVRFVLKFCWGEKGKKARNPIQN